MHFAIAEKETGKIFAFLREARVVASFPGKKGTLWVRYWNPELGRECEMGVGGGVSHFRQTLAEPPESGLFADVEEAPAFDPGDGPVPVDSGEAVEGALEDYIQRIFPARKQNRIILEKLCGEDKGAFEEMKNRVQAAREAAVRFREKRFPGGPLSDERALPGE